MNDKKLLKIGVLGALFVCLLCFTPIVVIVFGFLGLSAWAAYTDVVLLPLFAGIALVALFLRLRKKKHD